MDFTPEHTTVIGARAYLDQISAHRDTLTRQITNVWADLPPEARDVTWARLDDTARAYLTQALTTAEHNPASQLDDTATNDETELSTALPDADRVRSQDAFYDEYGRDLIDHGDPDDLFYVDDDRAADVDGWG